MICHFVSDILFFFIFLNIKNVENGLGFLIICLCESNKKLKDLFVKVES